jgi:hypothetical protein
VEGQRGILRNKRKFNIKVRRLYGSGMRMEGGFNRPKLIYNSKFDSQFVELQFLL